MIEGLKPLFPAKRQTPYSPVLSLDIETSSKGELLDIGLYDGQKFWHIEQKKRGKNAWQVFFELLLKTTKPLRVIAHNGFGFDYIGFVQWLLDHYKDYDLWDSQIQILSSESLIVGLIIKREGADITFIDTLRFFPGQSLNRLAKDFLNDEKDDVPDDYISRMEEYKERFPSLYYQYLEKDCRILYGVYDSFREGINSFQPIGELGLSSGSTAMKSFRAWMAKDDFFVYACPPEYLGAANMAMRGGLTLFIGDGQTDKEGIYKDTYHYDVVSMYPSVMRSVPVPCAPMRALEPRESAIDAAGNFRPGWYLADFEQTEGRVPLLYSTDSKDPVWKGQGILSHFDMEFLKRFGRIGEIYDGCILTDYIFPFEPFLNDLLSRRMKAKKEKRISEAQAYKIVLNSLYGKFSQQATREQLAITSNFDWYDSKIAAQLAARGQSEFMEYYRSDGVVLYGVETQSTSFSNRFIGATVTSLARLKLGCVYNLVPTIYCDTDSIFSQRQLPAWLIGNEPGCFEHCEPSPMDMICLGKKSYSYGDDVTWKGIPKNKLVREDLEKIQNGAQLKVEYRTPTAFKTAIKKGIKRPNEFTPKFRTARSGKSLKKQGILREAGKYFSSKKVQDFFRFLFESE